MNEDLDCNFLVFYAEERASDNFTPRFRIAASCLGDALTVAKAIGDMSRLNIIGVSPDLGVRESTREEDK